MLLPVFYQLDQNNDLDDFNIGFKKHNYSVYMFKGLFGGLAFFQPIISFDWMGKKRLLKVTSFLTCKPDKGTFKYHMTLQGGGGLFKPSQHRHMREEDLAKSLYNFYSG